MIAIDPGPTHSAWVRIVDGKPVASEAHEENEALLERIRSWSWLIVIEKIESFGMSVGAEVFETVYWTGRFAQAAIMSGHPVARVTRREVKLHLCGTSRAKDPNVRQALLDRFGEKGTKAAPGILYGIKGDAWSALAVGVTYYDRGSV